MRDTFDLIEEAKIKVSEQIEGSNDPEELAKAIKNLNGIAEAEATLYKTNFEQQRIDADVQKNKSDKKNRVVTYILDGLKLLGGLALLGVPILVDHFRQRHDLIASKSETNMENLAMRQGSNELFK